MRKLYFNKILSILILLIAACFLFAHVALAQDFATSVLRELSTENCDCSQSNYGDGSADCREYCGDYEPDDFVKVVVRVSQVILGLSGSLALLAFIYGGVMFLISSGSSEKVAKAKQIIIGAVIGLIVIFASWIIIGFAFQALGIEANWATLGGIWK